MTLGVLFALMLVLLTPALRSYLQQREEITQLKQNKASTQASVSDLENQKKQWQNPAFVKKQAQERLGFGMPGQQITVYVDNSGTSHTVQNSSGVTNASGLKDHPWYGQLWGSVTSTTSGKN